MRVAIVAAAVLLAGCQRTATEEALIKKAQKTAFLPDCASLRVIQGRQMHFPDDPELDNLVVTYRASSQCMDEWTERLSASDWPPGRHGVATSRDDKISVNIFSESPRNQGFVMWFQSAAEPGVISQRTTRND